MGPARHRPACYALALRAINGLGGRAVVAAILAAHLIFLLGPPLFSADVFGYVAYARLGALHHLDPYAHGAFAAPLDPVFSTCAGVTWRALTGRPSRS